MGVMCMLTFGPIPSRRLGRSIGINSIPPKNCTYACVYCQVGRTTGFSSHRQNFYEPEILAKALEERLQQIRANGEKVDYVTFVPDGEPTLDARLGEAHRLVRALGVPVAVITNGSMMGCADVRKDLLAFDLVSIKVDSVDPQTWLKTDRPHPGLELKDIMRGALLFAEQYGGRLLTETMLVDGMNDADATLEQTAGFIAQMRPFRSYISVPTRPPMEKWVKIPSAERLASAYSLFSEHVSSVELLTGYEGNAFAASGDPGKDLLDITAVHPMRRDAVEDLLERSNADWNVVETLTGGGKLKRIEYSGQEFYLRTPADGK